MNKGVITWLPDHPHSGSISMQRYWQELDRAAQQMGLQVDCPFSVPSALSGHRVSRFQRAWTLYADYPRIVRRIKSPWVHILDHSRAYLMRYLPFGTKTIVTVHDVIPLVEHSELTAQQLRRIQHSFNWLKNADLLVAISAYTKAQLMDLLGIDETRICVIHNGFSSFSLPISDATVGLIENEVKQRDVINLLSVGSTIARKNMRILPSVLRHLLAEGKRPRLFRVGAYFDDVLRNEIVEIIGDGQLLEMGRASDSVLGTLYKKCDLLFFPSLYEGFGLPVLEAMGQGCPVVCSNTTSLPEVGGEAALYFDPLDPAEAAKQILCAMEPQQRCKMVEAGYRRVILFSWEKCVGEYSALYRKVMGSDSAWLSDKA